MNAFNKPMRNANETNIFMCSEYQENKIYTINSKQHNYTQLDNNDKLYIYTCIFELRYDQKKKKTNRNRKLFRALANF